MTIQENDELLEVRLTNGRCEVLMAVKSGRCIRFNESLVRPTGRTAQGVKGIYCESGDEVVGMICIDKEDQTKSVMVVSEKGYGKRSDLDEYRITSRGGKGVKTLNITDKTGNLIAMKDVTEQNDLMIINKSGVTIRMNINDIKIQGRATQGVRVIRLSEDDEIAAVAVIDAFEEISNDILNTTDQDLPKTDSEESGNEENSLGN